MMRTGGSGNSPCVPTRAGYRSFEVGGCFAEHAPWSICRKSHDHLTKTTNLVFIGDTYLCCQLGKFTGQSGQEALCCCGIVAGEDGMPSAVGLMA
jgi:hypothetical protein